MSTPDISPTNLTRMVWLSIGVVIGWMGVPVLLHVFYWVLMVGILLWKWC